MSILSNLLLYLVGMWLQKLILISFLVSCFIFKTLRERFHAPSVFLNRSHSVFVFLPQCF